MPRSQEGKDRDRELERGEVIKYPVPHRHKMFGVFVCFGGDVETGFLCVTLAVLELTL